MYPLHMRTFNKSRSGEKGIFFDFLPKSSLDQNGSQVGGAARRQGWVLIKEALEALELIGFEALRSQAQQGEMAAVALDDWSDLAAEVHEVKH